MNGVNTFSNICVTFLLFQLGLTLFFVVFLLVRFLIYTISSLIFDVVLTFHAALTRVLDFPYWHKGELK